MWIRLTGAQSTYLLGRWGERRLVVFCQTGATSTDLLGWEGEIFSGVLPDSSQVYRPTGVGGGERISSDLPDWS